MWETLRRHDFGHFLSCHIMSEPENGNNTGIKFDSRQRPQSLPSTLDHRVSSARPYTFFSTPASIRALFSHFPLITYSANLPPVPSLQVTTGWKLSSIPSPILYVFTNDNSEDRTPASFNSTCLKWQTWLLSQRVELDVRPSNNHASPSGSLPFLVDWSSRAKDGSPRTVGARGFETWLQEVETGGCSGDQNHNRGDTGSMELRIRTYLSLVDQQVRPAWVSVPKRNT